MIISSLLYKNTKYSWDLFYKTETPSITTTTDRFSTSISNSYYMKNCFFNNLSSTTYGGAIYISSSSYDNKVLIEETTISECFSLNRGGGIYFTSNGQIVLYKICGNKCYNNGGDEQYGQFSYTEMSSASNNLIPHN